MVKKYKFILANERVNRNGRKLNFAGIDLAAFIANPLMFFEHDRWAKPIGRWEDIKVEVIDGETCLTAYAVFDLKDELGADIARRVQDNFIRSCSLGAVKLFEVCGGNAALLGIFRKSQTVFNETKLKEFLQKLLLEAPPPPTGGEISTMPRTDRESSPPPRTGGESVGRFDYSLKKYETHADAAVRKLAAELKKSYRIKDNLFASLELLPTDAARKEAAFEILALAKEIKECWEDLQYYEIYKKFAVKNTEKPLNTNIVYLMNRKKTLQANISRDKKRKPEKVKDWEKELAEVEKMMYDV